MTSVPIGEGKDYSMKVEVRKDKKRGYENDEDLKIEFKGEFIRFRLQSNCEDGQTKENAHFDRVVAEVSALADRHRYLIVIGADVKPDDEG